MFLTFVNKKLSIWERIFFSASRNPRLQGEPGSSTWLHFLPSFFRIAIILAANLHFTGAAWRLLMRRLIGLNLDTPLVCPRAGSLGLAFRAYRSVWKENYLARYTASAAWKQPPVTKQLKEIAASCKLSLSLFSLSSRLLNRKHKKTLVSYRRCFLKKENNSQHNTWSHGIALSHVIKVIVNANGIRKGFSQSRGEIWKNTHLDYHISANLVAVIVNTNVTCKGFAQEDIAARKGIELTQSKVL